MNVEYLDEDGEVLDPIEVQKAHEEAIARREQAIISSTNKLKALGLTMDEIKALR